MLEINKIMRMQKKLNDELIEKNKLFKIYSVEEVNKKDRLLNSLTALIVDLSKWIDETNYFKVWSSEKKIMDIAFLKYVTALNHFASLANQLEIASIDFAISEEQVAAFGKQFENFMDDLVLEGTAYDDYERFFLNKQFQEMINLIINVGHYLDDISLASESLCEAFNIFFVLGIYHFGYGIDDINECCLKTKR